MPRVSSRPKLDSFNFRVEGDLKRAFLEVAEKEDRRRGPSCETSCGPTSPKNTEASLRHLHAHQPRQSQAPL